MEVTERVNGVLFADGTMEVVSNDRQLKIAIVKCRIFQDGEQREIYRSEYWVKDGLEWERVNDSANYNTPDEFLDTIDGAEDFSRAVADIKAQREENRTTD